FRAESGREVVAAALDKEQLHVRVAPYQVVDGFLIVRGVLTDGRMRTAAGLHAEDAVLRQHAALGEKLRVLFGKDVVRHDGEAIAVAQPHAERLDQRGLAGPHRPADADDRDVLGAGLRRLSAAVMTVLVMMLA